MMGSCALAEERSYPHNMGFLDHLPRCFSCSFPSHKRLPLQTVNLRVKMDCQGCVRKVRSAVEGLKGVESVDINQKEQRVTVKGYVEAEEVIEEVKSTTGKKVEAWPFVDHELVTYPYQIGVYDTKAPNGFVRNVPQALGDPKTPEMKLMVLFNDDNPNACSIM